MNPDHAPVPPSAVKEAMRSALRNRMQDLATWDRDAHQRINRVRIPIEDIAALHWLSVQTDTPRTYWANRNREFRMAGVGCTHLLTGDGPIDLPDLQAKMASRLNSYHPHLRYYGGLQFDLDAPVSSEWSSFGAYRFIIPEFEVYRKPGHTYFACNFRYLPDAPQALEALFDRLADIQFDLVLPDWEEHAPLLRRDHPEKTQWLANVEAVLKAMENGSFEKIVLARRAALEFTSNLNPLSYLLRLRMMSEDTFNFFFQPDADHAFVGASPERLFRREGRQLVTEAIAGTRPRGRTKKEDQALRKELLQSDKELREHDFVVNMIREELEPLSIELNVDKEVSTTRLSHVQHLCKRFSARLADEVSDADLLQRLHPTPAVGGYPREEALAMLRKIEPFPRGWYSGPVGFIGHDLAEFVVAIRSGLIERQRISLYSGAGIVRGSLPEAEWNEIEDKIGKFLKALEF